MTENETQNTTPEATPSRKRRWGKRAFIGALLLALGLGSGFAIGAKSGHYGRLWHGMGHEFDAKRAAERIDHRVEKVMSRIDGTPEQQQKVAAIAKSTLNDLMALGITPRETRMKFVELLRAETIDPVAFETLRAEQVAKFDTASKRVVSAVTDAAAVLTPTQRHELTERMNKRFSR
jgi:Spy/CpxP family protein refolding chaperone